MMNNVRLYHKHSKTQGVNQGFHSYVSHTFFLLSPKKKLFKSRMENCSCEALIQIKNKL